MDFESKNVIVEPGVEHLAAEAMLDYVAHVFVHQD